MCSSCGCTGRLARRNWAVESPFLRWQFSTHRIQDAAKATHNTLKNRAVIRVLGLLVDTFSSTTIGPEQQTLLLPQHQKMREKDTEHLMEGKKIEKIFKIKCQNLPNLDSTDLIFLLLMLQTIVLNRAGNKKYKPSK